MARRTKEEAEATRDGIIDAAELCFLEDGVFRTTLERIAARAGRSRGAVYWHFKNKLDVLEAVMERVELPMFDQLEQMVETSGSRPLIALRRSYKNAFEEFSRNPHARNALEIAMLRCELVDETRRILDRKQRGMARAIALLTEAFEHAQKLGQLRPGLSPIDCARSLRFLVIGALREWLLDPKAVSLQRDAFAAVDLMLRGFAAAGALEEESADER
ncbi:MAG: TetR family transcriptional regulator [Steroidobacteraceae bacterium]|jgi:TetR/AcrR family acrAB operon transcriptional repressor|nr:TetR family transcriptional regulator [Steroidobacteraceae bacterium]